MKYRKLLLNSATNLDLVEGHIDVKLAPDQILVKVVNSGICGSDLHYFKDGGLGTFPSPMPMHLGHEVSGYVADGNNSEFKDGDAVAVEPGHSCGGCDFCSNDRPNICADVKFLGANMPGGQGDYIIVNVGQLIKLNDSIDHSVMALLEPYSVGLHNSKLINKVSTLVKKDRLAVIGGGTIGYSTALALLQRYPGSEVTVFEKSAARRNILQEINSNIEVRNISDTQGMKGLFDVVYDAVGSSNTFFIMQSLVGNGGVMVLIGIPELDYLMVNPHAARVRELTLIFSRRSAVLDLGEIRESYLEALPSLKKITTKIYLPEQGQLAYENAANWSADTMRTQIDWSHV